VQLRDDRDRFETAGAAIVLIGLGTPERASWFCEDKAIPFPCLADPGQAAYRAYGLRTATVTEVLRAENALRYLRLNLNPETRQRTAKAGEDVLQLGGTFVVDTQGVMRYAHRNRHTGDNPPNDEVLEAIGSLKGA
jgi:peroxiredoxin